VIPKMNKPNLLKNVRVVLMHTSHPGNIGAAARAMKTMGLDVLYLVKPERFPDAEATARATGASDVLERAKVCASLDDALAGTALAVAVSARRRDLSHKVLTPREVAPLMLEYAGTQQVALVFGNETSGLSNAEVGKCQLQTSIPANPEFSSLNLAAAVQVLAYELRSALPEAGNQEETTRELAKFDDIERFYVRLEGMMVDTGFLDPAEPKRLMLRIRRMFARAGMEPEELAILQGVLTAIKNS
jgi:tRNA/rRNA methyltransferase